MGETQRDGLQIWAPDPHAVSRSGESLPLALVALGLTPCRAALVVPLSSCAGPGGLTPATQEQKYLQCSWLSFPAARTGLSTVLFREESSKLLKAYIFLNSYSLVILFSQFEAFPMTPPRGACRGSVQPGQKTGAGLGALQQAVLLGAAGEGFCSKTGDLWLGQSVSFPNFGLCR